MSRPFNYNDTTSLTQEVPELQILDVQKLISTYVFHTLPKVQLLTQQSQLLVRHPGVEHKASRKTNAFIISWLLTKDFLKHLSPKDFPLIFINGLGTLFCY